MKSVAEVSNQGQGLVSLKEAGVGDLLELGSNYYIRLADGTWMGNQEFNMIEVPKESNLSADYAYRPCMARNVDAKIYKRVGKVKRINIGFDLE